MYIYIYTHVHLYIHIHMYIHMCTGIFMNLYTMRERERVFKLLTVSRRDNARERNREEGERDTERT